MEVRHSASQVFAAEIRGSSCDLGGGRGGFLGETRSKVDVKGRGVSEGERGHSTIRGGGWGACAEEGDSPTGEGRGLFRVAG